MATTGLPRHHAGIVIAPCAVLFDTLYPEPLAE